jgi:FkbM family methyltransferase
MATNGEENFVNKVIGIMDSKSLVIDVGANIGDFLNLFMSQKSNFSGKILAIDPLPGNIVQAQTRFSDQLSQIIWVQCVATNFVGQVDFYKHLNRNFSAGDSMKPMTNIGLQNESERIMVEANTLSAIVQKTSQLMF